MAEKYGKNSPPTTVIIGIDNTAAITLLNERIVLFDSAADELLQHAEAVYEKLGWSWKAVYITGLEQPADEPSRLAELDLQKCDAARRLLSSRRLEWYEKLGPAAGRRPRSPTAEDA